ncbi:hypothetical protein B0T14DRAFT_493561 [Immersiella caudata]|uniref:Uncharacterized protein n=1 Tax=Immersiella caudata TaxID=314043 RepID=A0AA39X5T9_9PEZI|nr:hypothetical protein B0T14DRAFT_493561 [Immersiella caudata]
MPEPVWRPCSSPSTTQPFHSDQSDHGRFRGSRCWTPGGVSRGHPSLRAEALIDGGSGDAIFWVILPSSAEKKLAGDPVFRLGGGSGYDVKYQARPLLVLGSGLFVPFLFTPLCIITSALPNNITRLFPSPTQTFKMLYKATILGFAAAASASLLHPADAVAHIQARQTDVAGATACISALAELLTLIPTPPPEVLSWALENPITDACDMTKLPESLSSAASSYQSEAVSFLVKESAKLSSIVSVCPDASSALNAIDQATLTCDAAGSTKTGSADTSATDAATKSGASSGPGSQTTGTTGGARSSSTQTAGGARETGFVGAAIAAVGFLGVVAAL